MAMFQSLSGQPISARGSGTTLASAGFTASTYSNAVYYVTDLHGTYASGSIVKILVSGTVVFQKEYGASGSFEYSFETPFKTTKGQEVTASIDGAGTSIINMVGFRTLHL